MRAGPCAGRHTFSDIAANFSKPRTSYNKVPHMYALLVKYTNTNTHNVPTPHSPHCHVRCCPVAASWGLIYTTHRSPITLQLGERAIGPQTEVTQASIARTLHFDSSTPNTTHAFPYHSTQIIEPPIFRSVAHGSPLLNRVPDPLHFYTHSSGLLRVERYCTLFS